MTYKLNPALSVISSPVTLCFPNGSKQNYQNGKEVAEAIFDTGYTINAIKAEENTVVIILEKTLLPENGEGFF